MRAIVFSIQINRRTLWITGGVFIFLLGIFYFGDRAPRRISADKVYKIAGKLGEENNLDADFIFAIAMAESSLNSKANSGYARGMMQMSFNAWRDTTRLPYDLAYDWRLNLKVATRYLAFLRDQLAENGKFSYPRLAAAYRYGIGALQEADYSVSAMPQPANDIYEILFAGQMIDVRQYGVDLEVAA